MRAAGVRFERSRPLVDVHQRPPGLRPTLELEPTDHPLAVHQREGIRVYDLIAILQPFFHD